MDALNERLQAALELNALLNVAGALRIITNEHACGGGKHPSLPGFDEAACAACPYPLTDPRHFVIHDVVRLSGPDARGRMRAYSAVGDWCEGEPPALLKRLREARAGAPEPIIPRPAPEAPRDGWWGRVVRMLAG